MRLGQLHVHLISTRQWHTQTKWPDGKWNTNYMESDTDTHYKFRPNSLDEWTSRIENRSITLHHHVVTRHLIKFEIIYRSLWFELGNCTKWRPSNAHS